jgi:hypothetical protein
MLVYQKSILKFSESLLVHFLDVEQEARRNSNQINNYRYHSFFHNIPYSYFVIDFLIHVVSYLNQLLHFEDDVHVQVIRDFVF